MVVELADVCDRLSSVIGLSKTVGFADEGCSAWDSPIVFTSSCILTYTTEELLFATVT
jgi:hypothetical protein